MAFESERTLDRLDKKEVPELVLKEITEETEDVITKLACFMLKTNVEDFLEFYWEVYSKKNIQLNTPLELNTIKEKYPHLYRGLMQEIYPFLKEKKNVVGDNAITSSKNILQTKIQKLLSGFVKTPQAKSPEEEFKLDQEPTIIRAGYWRNPVNNYSALTVVIEQIFQGWKVRKMISFKGEHKLTKGYSSYRVYTKDTDNLTAEDLQENLKVVEDLAAFIKENLENGEIQETRLDDIVF